MAAFMGIVAALTGLIVYGSLWGLTGIGNISGMITSAACGTVVAAIIGYLRRD